MCKCIWLRDVNQFRQNYVIYTPLIGQNTGSALDLEDRRMTWITGISSIQDIGSNHIIFFINKRSFIIWFWWFLSLLDPVEIARTGLVCVTCAPHSCPGQDTGTGHLWASWLAPVVPWPARSAHPGESQAGTKAACWTIGNCACTEWFGQENVKLAGGGRLQCTGCQLKCNQFRLCQDSMNLMGSFWVFDKQNCLLMFFLKTNLFVSRYLCWEYLCFFLFMELWQQKLFVSVCLCCFCKWSFLLILISVVFV